MKLTVRHRLQDVNELSRKNVRYLYKGQRERCEREVWSVGYVEHC